MLFNEIIKQLRLEKGLSQKEIANAIGVDRTTYNKYETGKSQPDFDTVQKLADFFGVSVDYLLGRSDTRNSDVIEEAIKDDPELERIWNMLNNREEVRVMFKKIADLKPADVKRILKIIEIVEEEDSASRL
ncbi:helix-turn-helix domain-containing protein [Mahella australiensis]|uniref:Helix-turn-helix domain protein n=1 Tax=Mahella australiensis (strain DSM 15567 / CIP 107919 / 50-1 BON) TaxID=697281 RepID=F3ZVU8_MAHA5|nr:helix-turn-helix transcriptional regulator [Mahella australiensis]AEE95322.1 helix-turn-helix domain protein [Mahella australiensis 50-1 BON]